MAETKIITKQLAGTEDIITGIGTVSQQRSTGIKTIKRINPSEMKGAIVLATIADLEALVIDELGNTKTVIVQDENRGGIFHYKGTGVDDGGTIFKGWHRQYEGAVNPKWFGAKGDYVTDDSAIISNVLNSFKYVDLGNNDIYYIGSTIEVTNEDVEILNGGFTTNNVSTLGIMFKFKGSIKVENVVFESQDTNFTVVETSAPGDFIWFDSISTPNDIDITINNCTFFNAKNDAISGGEYTGTGNIVNTLNITNNSFYKSQRYDITVRNCNNSMCSGNYSEGSGAFVDYEPSGDTNKMLKVSVTNNIVKDCFYNAIQVSAGNINARGLADISGNLIEMSSSYNPSVATKQAIGIRTNKATISNNTMKGGYDRLMGVNGTEATINGNVASMEGTGEHYEYIKLTNSTASIGNNIFNSSANLLNDEINADADSSYTSINTNSSILELGNMYEQEVHINGSSGLESRAKLRIGDLVIDTTGASGSEYTTLSCISGQFLKADNSSLDIGYARDINMGGKYEQKINLLGNNQTLGARVALRGGAFVVDMQPEAVWFINNTKQFMGHDGTYLRLFDIPTSDPAVAGALWNDSGTVKISNG